MTMRITRLLTFIGLTAMLALAACSKTPAPKTAAAAPAAMVTTAEIGAVQALLMQGDRKGAEKALKPLLKRQPARAELVLLQTSLEGNAKEQLGPVNYPYTVRAGDTVEALAERTLGNRLKAYQLARYNDLQGTLTLTPGQVLRIPGSPPRPKPAPAAAVERPSRPAPSAPRPKPVAAAPAVAAPAAATKPAANPAAAQRARGAGLAALNRGAVNDAVNLLARAQALDPGNALIARDLQRAQRIAATVKSRK